MSQPLSLQSFLSPLKVDSSVADHKNTGSFVFLILSIPLHDLIVTVTCVVDMTKKKIKEGFFLAYRSRLQPAVTGKS